MKYRDAVVARTSDLKDGEMKIFSAEGSDVLLARIDGKLHALGAYCTHYGAPLDQGILHGDRIVCPWHHACFHAKTGDLQEPPAHDALPRYEVKVDGEEIIVRLPEQMEGNRLPGMVKQDEGSDGRTFLFLGAGAAANSAAQTLREDGYRGKIIMLTYENRVPYDRPNLSKDYLQGEAEEEWMPLRPEDFYRAHDIDLRKQSRFLSLDSKAKEVLLEDGSRIQYDKVLLATGGRPRRLNIPGADLKNVFTLRSFDDSDAIIEASKNSKNAVVIGASFIAMETAASLRHRNIPVTVVAPETVPFEAVFGREIGEMLQALHRENGVKFRLGHTAASFEGQDKVAAIVLEDGSRLEADLVIVGVGVEPVTDYLRDIDTEPDGSVKVDRYFHVKNDVYAAGDIATFPDWHTGLGIRIEHWRTALQQGRYAAHNMAGKETPFESVPFFWTVQAGQSLRYVGHVRDWEEVIVHGDVAKRDFIAFYVKNHQIHAAAGMNRDRQMAMTEELMRSKNMPNAAELRKASLNLAAHLRS